MAAAPNLQEFQKLLVPGGFPELGPGPRAGVLSESALDESLDRLFANSRLPSASRQLIRSLLLLWHDHMDAAHTIAQEIENADGSFIHGIVHRREPDYGNAAYWFRRVGPHPCFPAISKRVSEWLTANDQHALQSKLVSNGKWAPFALIDECEKAASRPPKDPLVESLRKIQGIESVVLLEYFLQS